ncbi:MAG: response regulator [Phycisphaerales bacterium]|nr:response regulator [Hyphomonadaceae bacterium]
MAQEPLISIIDDDDSLRTALVGLVRSLGYRASAFGSATEFLAAGEPSASDCIVTDIHMPGLSGIELKQRLTQEGCAVPVIMITARMEPGLEERAVASGAACFLRKPFEVSALVACVEKALKRQP